MPAGATVPESASLQYTHDAATIAFNMIQNMDRALFQQLLGVVKDNSIRVFYIPHQYYRVSSTLDMITHLYTTYDVIINTDWLANNKLFRESHAPIDLIELVWRHIDNTVAYADAGSTRYSRKQVIGNTYHILFNTGLFAADCW